MNGLDLLALPADIYQRHLAASQIAGRARAHLNKASLRVLDVGGFSRTPQGNAILPLAHFLPEDDVLAIDLQSEFVPGYAVASGLHIPFSNGAFDLVTSCDTIEHVSPPGQEAFVSELLRVTAHFTVLIAPFDGDLTRSAERTLHDCLATWGIHSPPLQEHLDHGLPSLQSLKTVLANRQLAAVDLPDGYLPHWLAMMLFNHTQDQSLELIRNVNRYYNQYFSPRDRREPAYRRVVVVAQPGDEGVLPSISDLFCGIKPPAAGTDIGFMPDLVELLGSFRSAVTETQEQLRALESENAWLRQQLDGYERGRFMRFMRRVQSWKKRVGLA
jgi:hypothetical protein